MNHKIFWEKYLNLASEEEQMKWLKTYMFSLPPQEMKTWIVSDVQSLFAELKQDLNDPNVSDDWKKSIATDISKIGFSLESLKISLRQKKAA